MIRISTEGTEHFEIEETSESDFHGGARGIRGVKTKVIGYQILAVLFRPVKISASRRSVYSVEIPLN